MKKSFTIHDLPKMERPREKLIAKGPQNLKDLPRRELVLLRGEELL